MSRQLDLLMTQFSVGDRVERGCTIDGRWRPGVNGVGEVVKIGGFYLHVQLDGGGSVVRVVPENARLMEGR